MPIYPAIMEVILPDVKDTAVYGKLTGATLAFISSKSTVHPRTMANRQVQITKYKYSL
jgi:hypothetical protein